MDWTTVPHGKQISPHFTFREFLAGHPASYLDKRNCDPGWIVKVFTVAELARIKYNELLDVLRVIEDRPRGISVSSGVRTPSSNRGVSKSVHMISNGVAMDFRPAGNWKACDLGDTPDNTYTLFYGCFVFAVSQCLDHFGLGYYPKSLGGIHVDCAHNLRESQYVRFGHKNHGFRGHRWMYGRSHAWNDNKTTLIELNKRFASEEAPRPVMDWAESLGASL